MLTIFNTPKPFLGHFKTIQMNAIRSWLALKPACEVILFGEDEGTAEAALELGVRHVPDIKCNEHGTPLVSDIFEKAREMANNEILGFISTDVILMSDFTAALKLVSGNSFLMIGCRWDLDLSETLDFDDPSWEQSLRDRVIRHGKLHPPTAVDYIVFNRNLYKGIPPFAVGRSAYDNWLIYQARFLGVPVVDATEVVTAVHQNHDLSFKIGESDTKGQGVAYDSEQSSAFWKSDERSRNIELLGGLDKGFTIEHATRVITPHGIKPVMTPRRLYFRLAALPVIHPCLGFLRKPMRALTRCIIGIRRMLGITNNR